MNFQSRISCLSIMLICDSQNWEFVKAHGGAVAQSILKLPGVFCPKQWRFQNGPHQLSNVPQPVFVQGWLFLWMLGQTWQGFGGVQAPQNPAKLWNGNVEWYGLCLLASFWIKKNSLNINIFKLDTPFVLVKILVWGIGNLWRLWMVPNWF